eukprot:UN31141
MPTATGQAPPQYPTSAYSSQPQQQPVTSYGQQPHSAYGAPSRPAYGAQSTQAYAPYGTAKPGQQVGAKVPSTAPQTNGFVHASSQQPYRAPPNSQPPNTVPVNNSGIPT